MQGNPLKPVKIHNPKGPPTTTVPDTPPIVPVTDTTTPASIVIPASASGYVGHQIQLTAAVDNALGNPLSVAVDAWHSDNLGVATVDPTSGLVTIVAEGTIHITATIASPSLVSNTCTLTATTLVVTPPPTDIQAAILALAGPTVLVADMPAGVAWYDTLFSTYAEQQWTDFGAAWDAGNTISEYERPLTYYVWWIRTGDTKWRDRASALLVNWRDNYLLNPASGDGNSSPHYMQAESLLAHFVVTGDTVSRDALIGVASRWIAFLSGYLTNLANPDLEHRVQTRVLETMWMAEKITGTPSANVDTVISQILSTLGADGYAPFAQTCGGSLNYMGGMLYDTLTRIYDQRPGTYNAAILANATAFANFLWASQWRGANPADASFNYLSVNCIGQGSPTSAPDENGLLSPIFGWLGKRTGDASWFTKGDQVLAGMQQSTGIYLYRQFSEQFSSSYRYLGYRYGP